MGKSTLFASDHSASPGFINNRMPLSTCRNLHTGNIPILSVNCSLSRAGDDTRARYHGDPLTQPNTNHLGESPLTLNQAAMRGTPIRLDTFQLVVCVHFAQCVQDFSTRVTTQILVQSDGHQTPR